MKHYDIKQMYVCNITLQTDISATTVYSLNVEHPIK